MAIDEEPSSPDGVDGIGDSFAHEMEAPIENGRPAVPTGMSREAMNSVLHSDVSGYVSRNEVEWCALTSGLDRNRCPFETFEAKHCICKGTKAPASSMQVLTTCRTLQNFSEVAPQSKKSMPEASRNSAAPHMRRIRSQTIDKDLTPCIWRM